MDEKDIFDPEQPEHKAKDFLRQQGFYIVLFVCLLIVGTAVALTALPREETPAAETTPGSVVESRQSGDETLLSKKTPMPTATPKATATPAPTTAPTTAPVAAKPVKKGQAPLSGEIVWSFAMDQLLYSRTLDQWTTHPGIDIAAEKGTEVKAVIAGTVERVYVDDALGKTVVVSHTNNRQSLYANLDETVPVKEGQKVNAGDVLGKVGATSVAECGEVSHLHFGFFVKDVPANPMDYVTIAH